jgi:hypothetical protein
VKHPALHDAATLRALYVGERLSVRAIAGRLGVAPITVCYWLRRHGIEARPGGWDPAGRELRAARRRELARIRSRARRAAATGNRCRGSGQELGA